jgi:hypothetical protein
MKRKAFYGVMTDIMALMSCMAPETSLLYCPHEKAPQLSLRFEEIHKEMTAIFS